MKSMRMRVAALAACCVILLAGAELPARGRQVTVYNPQVYNRTRQTMSNRAALRAALRKKRAKKAARARRAARRANVK